MRVVSILVNEDRRHQPKATEESNLVFVGSQPGIPGSGGWHRRVDGKLVPEGRERNAIQKCIDEGIKSGYLDKKWAEIHRPFSFQDFQDGIRKMIQENLGVPEHLISPMQFRFEPPVRIPGIFGLCLNQSEEISKHAARHT